MRSCHEMFEKRGDQWDNPATTRAHPVFDAFGQFHAKGYDEGPERKPRHNRDWCDVPEAAPRPINLKLVEKAAHAGLAYQPGHGNLPKKEMKLALEERILDRKSLHDAAERAADEWEKFLQKQRDELAEKRQKLVR